MLTVMGMVACTEYVGRDGVIGNYRADFYDSSENLTLMQDGTFEEVYEFYRPRSQSWPNGPLVPTDGRYYSSGRWEYSTEGEPKVIVRKGIVFQTAEPPPLTDWWLTPRKERGRVVLDEGDPDGVIILRKQD